MYGDSYGSYAAQAFALRYPERLRSLTLDGTYPLPGSDAAAADLAEAGRLGLELTCERSPGCPAAARDKPGRTRVQVRRSRARRPDRRLWARWRRNAYTRPSRRRCARADLRVWLLLPGPLARPPRRDPRSRPGQHGSNPATRRGDGHGRRGRRRPAVVLRGPVISRSSATTIRSSGTWTRRSRIGLPKSRSVLPRIPRARSSPSREPSGPAPTSRVGSRACAGLLLRRVIHPIRPAPTTRTCRRSS